MQQQTEFAYHSEYNGYSISALANPITATFATTFHTALNKDGETLYIFDTTLAMAQWMRKLQTQLCNKNRTIAEQIYSEDIDIFSFDINIQGMTIKYVTIDVTCPRLIRKDDQFYPKFIITSVRHN